MNYQLQRRVGRVYEATAAVSGDPRKLRPAPGTYRGWRIVRVDNPNPKRPLLGTRQSTKSDRSVEDVCRDYAEWAKAHGLGSVAVYPKTRYMVVMGGWIGAMHLVDPEAQFHVFTEEDVE